MLSPQERGLCASCCDLIDYSYRLRAVQRFYKSIRVVPILLRQVTHKELFDVALKKGASNGTAKATRLPLFVLKNVGHDIQSNFSGVHRIVLPQCRNLCCSKLVRKKHRSNSELQSLHYVTAGSAQLIEGIHRRKWLL